MSPVILVARRTIFSVLTLVGVYYAVTGALTLFNIVGVTRQWTLLSGDPEFPGDAGLFGMLIAMGAAIWVALGIGTVAAGVRTLSGDRANRVSWGWLTGVAISVHVPWLLYRSIATGALPRPDAALQTRAAGLQFAAVAFTYILGWLLTRHRPIRRVAGTETQQASG